MKLTNNVDDLHRLFSERSFDNNLMRYHEIVGSSQVADCDIVCVVQSRSAMKVIMEELQYIFKCYKIDFRVYDASMAYTDNTRITLVALENFENFMEKSSQEELVIIDLLKPYPGVPCDSEITLQENKIILEPQDSPETKSEETPTS